MEPARWSAIEAAFEKAIALPPAERPALFATLPVDICDEVSELVLADSDSTALLHAVVDGAQAQLVPSPAQQFGPWHVTGKIGQGGMGAVYKVVRDDGAYSKTAALKILHLGLDSDVMLERFRQERQILAALEHPHIARLVDGGETADQVPYLVLEFVEGQSLTDYAAPLNQRARLKLFLQVCEAVEYLHRNLIVHRDLKPSNILVTADGTAKLLDFGIAKLVDSNPARTMTSWQALTPNYASPEQVRGGAISTASDVYSLGVILYELLTGGRPYQIDTNTPLEIDRLVCQTAPPPPNLGSDLDNIILMAMRKEADRRYRSVAQFAEDIERFLADRPVLARPDTFAYRARKFIRRNRLPIGITAVAFFALAGAVGVSLYQAQLAQQRFNDVRQLAARFLELHDDIAGIPGSVKVREKMVATAVDYLDRLSLRAGNDAELLNEIGQAYERVAMAQAAPGQPNLGRIPDGLASFRRAIDFEKRAAALRPTYHYSIAKTQSLLAYLAMLNGALPEARESIESASAILEQMRRDTPNNADVLSLASRVAITRGDLTEYEGRPLEGLPYFELAHRLSVEHARVRPTPDGTYRISLTLSLVAQQLALLKRFPEAITALREGDQIINRLLTEFPNNPLYARHRMTLANYEGAVYDDEVNLSLQQPAASVAAYRRYLALAQAQADADKNNAGARLSLAIAHYKLSYPLAKINPAEGLAMARQGVAILDAELAAAPRRLLHSRRARALRHLAYALQRNRQIPAARQAVEEAIAVQTRLIAEQNSDASEKAQLELSQRVLAGLIKSPSL